MPEWMTVEEAAAYLKTTRRTLYRWCDEGRLRWYELQSRGGRRFKREDLDALLKPGIPGRLDEKLDDLHRRMQVHMKARGSSTNAFGALADLVSQVSSGSGASRRLLLKPGLDRAINAAMEGSAQAEQQLVAEAAHLLRERSTEEAER